MNTLMQPVFRRSCQQGGVVIPDAGEVIGRLMSEVSVLVVAVMHCSHGHGAALGCIVDGCPPGLELSEADLQGELDRRKPGKSRHTTQRREADEVQILSGVFEGQTTGAPIGLIIHNTDQRSKDYSKIKDRFRPGHADYTYQQKYGLRDYRGGGRSSARETAMRVAAGAIARKYLRERYGVEIRGYLAQLGPVALELKDWSSIDQNPFFSPDPARVPELEAYMDALRKEGDSIGARINVTATGVPPGLGEPVFDRLDADIAQAMMAINAAKGVEIGAGFRSVVIGRACNQYSWPWRSIAHSRSSGWPSLSAAARACSAIARISWSSSMAATMLMRPTTASPSSPNPWIPSTRRDFFSTTSSRWIMALSG